MLKRIALVFVFVVAIFSMASASQASETMLINALTYHRSMFEADRGQIYLRVPVGHKDGSVGGSEQDPERYTPGVPFAFRPVKDGKVWILDSANKYLKLFSTESRLEKKISLREYGKVIRDFAFDGESGFWLLNPVDGFIYHIDLEGKLIGKIEGFFDARSIESGRHSELLVEMPMMASVLRFGKDKLLKEQYPCDESLTLIEGIGGKLLTLQMTDRNVELMLRSVASPAQNIPLAAYPLDIEDKAVTYAGARVLGNDAAGNLYLNLIACHESGAIYRDRLYKCSSAGKIMAWKDIIVTACLAPDIPRERAVTADGKVLAFHLEGNDYVLVAYDL